MTRQDLENKAALYIAKSLEVAIINGGNPIHCGTAAKNIIYAIKQLSNIESSSLTQEAQNE